MTGWIIVLLVCVILTIVFALISDDGYKVLPEFLSIIFGAFAVVAVFTLLFSTISTKNSIGQFQSQKAYIESHISKSPLEDATITSKKIEMNSWLFGAQQSQKNFGVFTFYPETIWDLEPIQ